MNIISKRGAVLAGAVLAATLNSPASNAATGSVAVDIDFPPLVVLYYFPNIDITVDPDDLEDALLGNTSNSHLSSCTRGSAGSVTELECETTADPQALSTSTGVAGGTITYNADINSDTTVSTAVDGTVSFSLENAWAVRALASGLTASVSLSGSGDFSNEAISPTAPDASLTLGGGNDNIGDLSFDVDLDSLSGLTASDTLTITVTAP
ncbi:MAG: hypothetical protein R3228_16515 [Halioglobus sp.]|nr:hypothetical protein [Halioglobus sp.]